MCTVSMISDHWMQKWPDPSKVTISHEEYLEYLSLKKRALEYDKQTNQPDCVKPEAVDWEKKVEEVLRKKGLI